MFASRVAEEVVVVEQSRPSRRGVIVAVDGPSGSGKSSVCRAAATARHYAYLDTGAMYRAMTWSMLAGGVELDDPAAITGWAQEVALVIGTEPSVPRVIVNHPLHGEHDVTDAIREPRISSAVSAVATNLDVRQLLKSLQRQIVLDLAESGRGVIAEGRDLTTVVVPDADVRVLLTASEAARLARRSAQDEAVGVRQSSEATADQVLRRDAADATVSQFLSAADGVTTLDSSDLDFDQTVQALLDLIPQKG